MKLKTLPRLPGERQTEFIQQWWLFNNRDNNSHESMLLHDIINQRLLFWSVLTERPPLGQKLYCAWSLQAYHFKTNLQVPILSYKIHCHWQSQRFENYKKISSDKPATFISTCLWGKEIFTAIATVFKGRVGLNEQLCHHPSKMSQSQG